MQHPLEIDSQQHSLAYSEGEEAIPDPIVISEGAQDRKKHA